MAAQLRGFRSRATPTQPDKLSQARASAGASRQTCGGRAGGRCNVVDAGAPLVLLVHAVQADEVLLCMAGDLANDWDMIRLQETI